MRKYKVIPNLKDFGYHLVCFFDFLGLLEAETTESFDATEVHTKNTEQFYYLGFTRT